MVLLYSQITSPRLQYICSFIFKELMQVDFSITIDKDEFEKYDGVKINYSGIQIPNCKFQIANSKLLFEKNVSEQNINCFEVNRYKAFFKTENSDFPFDVFAASFYLLSRYEEYLPHTKDEYGRYAHTNSLAFKEGFLKLPLINIWVKDFAEKLKSKYPILNIQYPIFNFIPTYDIDIAYSYKHKGFAKNVGGLLKSLFTFDFSHFTERLSVITGKKKDPYDTFGWLDSLHEKYKLKPIYFFLVAEKNIYVDKNILPTTNAMKQLIKQHAAKYPVGIHPSWKSGDDVNLLKKEINYLENISGKKITLCRRHYLRFNLPEDYRKLIDINMLTDYSMAYGTINGFRASVASSFYWYDLQNEEQTALRVFPFCYMEANSFYEQKNSAAEALDEMMYYANICKEVGGTYFTLWHNHMVADDKLYKGWGDVYERFLDKMK